MKPHEHEYERQILQLLGSEADEPELVTSIGRLLAQRPSAELLRKLRSETAAWGSRLEGEAAGGATREHPATLGSVRAVTGILGGYLDSLPPPPSAALSDQVLQIVKGHPSVRPSEIADELGRSRPQISAVLRRLRDEGLVEAEPPAVATDGRALRYRFTGPGPAAMEQRSVEVAPSRT